MLVCALGMAFAPAILACGDKIVGLGGGVAFARIHPGHYVGQIILFARRDSELQSYNEQMRFSHRLERSGHAVRLVDNDRDLEGAIHANATELILAAPADAKALRTQLSGDANAPLILGLATGPAAMSATDPETSNCVLQASINESKDILRTLENFISRRQAGTIIHCAAAGERS